jgi:toxin ParE1/3/4
MLPIIRTAQAESDLEDILDYLDQRNPQAAERFAAAVDGRCAQLSHLPEIGRARQELGPGLRSLVIEQYLLFYRITPIAIEVLRILHGARDLNQILTEENAH